MRLIAVGSHVARLRLHQGFAPRPTAPATGHAETGASEPVDGVVLAGALDARSLALVVEWARRHWEDLVAKSRQPGTPTDATVDLFKRALVPANDRR